jgi:hypothetical protein
MGDVGSRQDLEHGSLTLGYGLVYHVVTSQQQFA